MAVRLMILCLCLLCSLAAHAGELSGQLADQDSRIAVADAQLICLCTETGQRWMTRSHEDGSYAFKDLPPGTYWIAVAHPSYHGARQENLVLTRSNLLEQDFDMVALADPEANRQEVHQAGELKRSDQGGGNRSGKSGGTRENVRKLKNTVMMKLTEMFLRAVGESSDEPE